MAAHGMARHIRIAADIGGTFTDIAYLDEDGTLATGKLLSTPTNYADAVTHGITRLMGDLGLPLADVTEVLHGCTIATNAILEHKGAATALITTKGFRDVLELQRIRVPRLYDPLFVRPKPLVPRRLRFEVDERVDAKGEVVRPLDEADLGRAVAAIEAADVEAVAVCLLHSYANPAHERAIGEVLRRALPGRFVSLSVDVLPQMHEYERTSTTVINAYLGPMVKTYLEAMIEQLADAGVRGRLMVMQSSGGILDAGAVLDKPAHIVECGPAAGVIGAAQMGDQAGYGNLITFDMGGTTAKASIVEDGELSTSEEYDVGDAMSASSPLIKGGGYALRLPVINISEVGAGGGSIVWLDKAGSIKVGPQSAGAMPGPVCYGLGGEDPTMTDANVVLGFLNPTALAGGTVAVDADQARAAVADRIAGPLGRDLMETAYGIHTVANAAMMRAIKAVTTYRGRDPRDFTLFAFGGSGGVHAAALARELMIRQIIVPPAAGVFSALGLIFANLEINRSRAFLELTHEMSTDEAEAIYGELADEIAARLGHDRAAVAFQRLADMRYAGQAFELMVPLPDGPLDAAAIEELGRRFEAEHERRYGHAFHGEYPLEIVNLRLVGTVEPEGARSLARVRATAKAAPESGRRVYFGPETGAMETPIMPRAGLSEAPRRGPAIIEQYEGTVVVPPDCSVRLDDNGSIVIDLGEAQ